MHSNEDMVISAPTGSGKTVLFELAIVKMLRESAGTGQKVKCIYIAPTKSLCTEKARDWESKFAPFGAKCSELTGDTVNTGRGAWGDAKDATIIVTTGEKWDSLTRNWEDHSYILSQIQLFLIDEVHLLNETRGSTLEVVVSRMKLRGRSVRFIVVSATVPNIQDVADWIGNPSRDGTAIVKEFGEEFRPCKLSKFVYGLPRRKDTNDFAFAKALDYKCYSVLQQHCYNKPVLVFCATRKGVMIAAEQIFKEYEEATTKRESLPWSKPPRIEHVFTNKQLDRLAACGIGVHHAGISRDDRSATEQLYLKKVLKVLFATSTLAVGVNLPAHTVIIKGVKLYQNNAWAEYSDLDVMQMIGRAGRPQFDKEGVAVIMCEQELEAKYRALAQGQTILESSLHISLAEHINSEIALGTITSMVTAKEWLHSSFLYRRLRKNPAHYDIRKQGDRSWEDRMDELVSDSVTMLAQAEMISRDEGDALSSTEYGDIMSKFYIRQATMVQIMKLSEKASVREILEMLSSSEEFAEIKFRSGEKQVYNKLRAHHDIRYTIKKIEKPSDKVFILIQAILGAINLSDPEYKSAETQPYTESLPIIRHISRIARAVVEVANARKAGGLLKNALEVLRCLNAKAWEDRSVVFRQLDDIGLKSLKVLAEHNITSFAALRKMDPAHIEMLLNRKPPFGYDVLAAANQLPQYTLNLSEIDVTTRQDGVEVELSVGCGLVPRDVKAAKSKKNKKAKRYDMTLVLTLTSDHNFVDFRRISTHALKETRTFEITAKLTKPSQSIVVYISSDTFAGVTVSSSYKPSLASSAYPVMDTRPQDALARDLEGLEDIPDFWDMEGGDFDDEEMPVYNNTVQTVSKVKEEDLTLSTTEKSNLDCTGTTGIFATKQLPNGNFECNHTCKDKTKCRHLCCRDGLAKPPPMTKKRLEAMVEASASLTDAGGPSKPTSASHNTSKVKPKPKEASKVKSERSLKHLEALHQQTGVKENLHLGDRDRIKLDTDLQNSSKRVRRIVPDFDVEFARLDDGPTNPRIDISILSESDDELPDARGILGSLRGSDPGLPTAVSESTDYGDPEFDALIADLPLAGESCMTGAQKNVSHALERDKATANPARKRKLRSSESPRPAKRLNQAQREESPIEIRPSPTRAEQKEKAPSFDLSLSDEGASRPEVSQLFLPAFHSSPVTSPASAPMNDDDGFVLDTSFFDIVPSTPDLTAPDTTQSSQSHTAERDDAWPFRRFVSNHQNSTSLLGRFDDTSQRSPPRIEQQAMGEQDVDTYEDPLAEFEAWLNSGAVEIVEK
ncbi:P-loop containing nucleoside triphosphate hydrolase protein [Lentinus tigrinus ALCF2SS1-7]|uniref:P-loop containing nucleoside triphosphate hydrolase protein n=1 Tax=Lentinus tigrinus ALCF2SS1-7 TaxID=1328758 RepID=UPI001165E17E|nr:P-loop containing nucleoside triphosphate hydrolase protein [Lentinus tigrinus ALCF2SS1-7]